MRSSAVSGLLTMLLLAGCVTDDTAVTTIAPTDADRAQPAYQACLAAIAKTTGRPAADIAIFDYSFSEAGTRVQASVAGAEAPWSCLAANDGTVEEVMYTGSEGSL